MTYNKSQWRFWTNSIFFLSIFEELKAYVNNISFFIDDQAAHMQEHRPHEFEDDQSEAEYDVATDQFADRFPVLLCNSFIIVLVSELERQMYSYCEAIAHVNNFKINSSDFKTAFSDQFKHYVTKKAQFHFDFDGHQWNDIKGLFEVRNAIVHRSGQIGEARKSQMTKMNERYPTLNITGNSIQPTIPFCNQMIDLVHSFLENVTRVATDHYK